MQNTKEHPTIAPEAPDALSDSAARAEAWAGEPFLHSEEDPGVVLAPGTARRRALDEALAEIEAGHAEVRAEADEEEDEDMTAEGEAEVVDLKRDPGAVRRFRFRHPTASGKTI